MNFRQSLLNDYIVWKTKKKPYQEKIVNKIKNLKIIYNMDKLSINKKKKISKFIILGLGSRPPGGMSNGNTGFQPPTPRYARGGDHAQIR